MGPSLREYRQAEKNRDGSLLRETVLMRRTLAAPLLLGFVLASCLLGTFIRTWTTVDAPDGAMRSRLAQENQDVGVVDDLEELAQTYAYDNDIDSVWREGKV